MPDDALGSPLGAQGSWLESLGLVVDELSARRATAHLEVGPEHHTPWGVVHGGVYTTIVEGVASAGASLAVRDRGELAVGVNNSTDFFRPVRDGRVDVVAVPVEQGRTQQLWQVDILRHGDGKLVAQGRLRLHNVPLSRVR